MRLEREEVMQCSGRRRDDRLTNLSEEEGGSRDEVCRKIDILAADFLPFDIGLIILRPLCLVMFRGAASVFAS